MSRSTLWRSFLRWKKQIDLADVHAHVESAAHIDTEIAHSQWALCWRQLHWCWYLPLEDTAAASDSKQILNGSRHSTASKSKAKCHIHTCLFLYDLVLPILYGMKQLNFFHLLLVISCKSQIRLCLIFKTNLSLLLALGNRLLIFSIQY